MSSAGVPLAPIPLSLDCVGDKELMIVCLTPRHLSDAVAAQTCEVVSPRSVSGPSNVRLLRLGVVVCQIVREMRRRPKG